MGFHFLTCFLLFTTTFSSSSFAPSSSQNNVTSDSLDEVLENFALRALVRRRGTHTGALYRAPLPANLSGIEISIVRLTGKSLWDNGAKFTNFHIPPTTLSFPPVRRLAIMYQDLRNWSAHYYNVPGFMFIASVVGFRVFDVSNMKADTDGVREISVRTERLIEIEFPDLDADPDDEMMSRARCVHFARANGEFHLSPMKLRGVCYGSSQGHFSLVVPLEKKRKKKGNFWCLRVVWFVLGFCLLGFVGYLGVAGIKVLRTKKIQVMEREADDGEVFESRWVGGSKMPSATATRTQPESGPENGVLA